MRHTVFDSPMHTSTENPFTKTTTAIPHAGFTATTSLSNQCPSVPLQQSSLEAPLVLTKAERTIATLVAEGARNHDIARQLGVSHRTVESHLSNMFTKLGIGSRVQLALWVSKSPETKS